MSEIWKDYVLEHKVKANYSADTSGFGWASTYYGSSASNDNIPFDASLFHDKHTPPILRSLGLWGNYSGSGSGTESALGTWGNYSGYGARTQSAYVGSSYRPQYNNDLGGWATYPIAQVPVKKVVEEEWTAFDWGHFGGGPVLEQNVMMDWGNIGGNPSVNQSTMIDLRNTSGNSIAEQILGVSGLGGSYVEEDAEICCACYWPECSESFSSDKLLKDHISTAHLKARDYMCGYCEDEFTTWQDLRCHLDIYHPYDGADPLLKRMK